MSDKTSARYSQGDWRLEEPLAWWTSVAGGKGAHVTVSKPHLSRQGHYFLYPSPNTEALAISLALRFGAEAEQLRLSLLREAEAVDDLGRRSDGQSRGRGQILNKDPDIFAFFELAMVTVTFSYQALETYCNRVISNAEIEFNSRTMDKAKSIVPKKLGLNRPDTGSSAWQGMRRIEQWRNATVHMKSNTEAAGVRDRPTQKDWNLFTDLLDQDMTLVPKWAVPVIADLVRPGDPPRWLPHIALELSIQLK